MSHKPVSVMLQVLRGAEADKEIIHACQNFRCDNCPNLETAKRSTPVAAPKLYVFGYEIIIDIFEVKDAIGVRFHFLSMVDAGTTYHVVCMVHVGPGTPKSSKCFAKFMTYWQQWAGFPKVVSCDRGLHNRGQFSRRSMHAQYQ